LQVMRDRVEARGGRLDVTAASAAGQRCRYGCRRPRMGKDSVLRVVLAEDNYLVREGTRQVLAVGDAAALLEAVEEHRPDVVVTDIRMPPGPHMKGIEATHAIRSRWPSTGVVVLSQHARRGLRLRAARARHNRTRLPAQGAGPRPRRSGARAARDG
jgi:CheY-like chemotaxis protein